MHLGISKHISKAGFPESPSEETLLPPDQPPHGSKQNPCERSRLSLVITSKTCESVNWPVNRSLLCSETKAKISTSCINCSSLNRRHWHGRVIGKGASGSIKALLVRIKTKQIRFVGDPPLIGLLTICPECCTELGLHRQSDQMNRIHSFEGEHDTPGNMILGVSYEQMEELFSSRVIVLEGCFTTPFKTAGVDRQWKEWNRF